MSFKHFVCLAALSAMSAVACTTSRPPRQEAAKTFVGSPACRDCHQAIYDRWQTTLMANVVQDPRQHPKAIVGDFSTPNPLVTFTPADVDFSYGTKWKAALLEEAGRRLFRPSGTVGRAQQGVASLPRSARHRLVGGA